MSGVRDLAIRWYRKAFGAPAGADIREEGLDTVLDGNTAVALAEAAIASHAVLGGAAPASAADTVWLRELDRGGTNLFGETLSADAAEGPRGIVAAATGLALAGRRATAFLTGTDTAAAQDLLASAAGRQVPLVLHLVTQAATAHGSTTGSGHDTVHLCADSGWFILFARNVQQAVDFTFIARRVAEEALIPGLVVMDGAETALAVQDVRLPSPSQVEGFLGATRDEIASPTPAQRLLFGDRRRTLPAWHDLDEPMLSGALFGPEAFALGAAARRPFFDDFIATALARAIDDYGARTGRQHRVIARHKLDKAELILVAQGAAIETANLTADLLRKQHGLRVGVAGVQLLRPLPRNSLADALAGAEQVIVMERADAPLSADRPLTREVRGCLDRLESAPACRSVVYGVGGFPLRRRDIAALCTEINSRAQDPLYLGIAFDDDAMHPKREVLLDTLRRAYPDAAALGVRAPADAEPPPPKDSITIAIRHRGDGAALAGAAGALLFQLLGGRIRSRLTAEWPGVSRPRTDLLIHGGDSLQDPGDGITPDLTLDIGARAVTLHGDGSRLAIPVEDEALLAETLLGGLFGALSRASLVDTTARRISGARRELLVAPDESQRDAAMAAFDAGFGGLTDAGPAASAAATQRPDDVAPPAVRELARNDDHLASLPRFWDQAGVLYRDDETAHLTADPYLATGTMPPLSATFSDIARTRTSLPAFDGSLCTGCGLCWTRCPDSAIGVAAATPAALIDSGIRQTGAEAVRQVASKLAARIVAAHKKDDEPPNHFGPMLESAFDWLQEKAPLPDERKQAIRDGIHRIVAALGNLPVAVTQPFFADAEARQKDSAELLSIAINPDACKACGLCIASCDPGALTRRDQDADVLAEARTLWETWCTTPDTPGTSIEVAAGHPVVGSTASMLLSRYCQFAMAGGDPAEPGSGEKLAARLFLAAAEFQRQPVAQRFAAALDEAGDTLRSLVHDTLSVALPDADLDAIAEQLESTSSPRIDLGTLAEGVPGEAGDRSIDTRYLRRLIRLSNRVDAARHQLIHGPHGLGRARYGLTIAGGTAAWAGSFPGNPFQAPAVIEMNGAAPQLTAGLIEGHLDETTELVRLLRLARLETDKPDGLDWKREAVKALRWQDLDDDELELCPPMILLGSDDMLAARGLSQLIWLLNSRLPVKVLLLSSLDLGLVGAATTDTRAGVALLSLAQRNAYVAQTSLADPEHFGACAAEALAHDGPALLQVYAPSPSRDGYAADELMVQARLAVAGRVLPLFRYDPSAEGVFGSRIRLDGNPSPDSALVTNEDGAVTLGDWALGQRRFASHFKPLTTDAPAPLPLHDWLLLDTKDRKGKTPFVARSDADKESRFVPSAAMLRAADDTLRGWRTLQELAGVVTPFTRKLEAEIRAAVAEEHRAELDAQKQAATAELEEVRQKTQAEIAGHLRRRLLELATRRRE
jgi:pyruvate-ferredoxin/flavodoxin oxidoreductase